MSVELIEDYSGKVLTVKATGKLARDDYDHFVPEIERLLQKHGKLRILFEMHNFEGWTMSALWQDIKFDVKHFRDIERLAVVGERDWQKWMATFCRPFTTATIRYFEHAQSGKADEWLVEELPIEGHTAAASKMAKET